MGNKQNVSTTCPHCGKKINFDFSALMNDILTHPEKHDNLKTTVSTKRKQNNGMRIKCPYCENYFVIRNK